MKKCLILILMLACLSLWGCGKETEKVLPVETELANPRVSNSHGYANMSLEIPEGWVYQLTEYSQETGSFGIVFYPEGEQVVIRYEDVTDIRFEEAVDFGECLSGGEKNGYSYGQWKNNRWGEYELCAEIKLECAVVLETEACIYALNAESYGTTKELARSLYDLLAEEGYLPAQ